jgi:hypothetical protein
MRDEGRGASGRMNDTKAAGVLNKDVWEIRMFEFETSHGW